MKKLIITSAFMFLLFVSNSQVLSVYYSDKYDCNSQVFFAQRVVQNGEVSFRLSVFKTVSPGSTVTFDLDAEMTEVYLPASNFADPTRPMFGGTVGEVTAYYDATMDIHDVSVNLEHLCSSDSGKRYITRDGEFHFTIVDDLNGLIR